MLNRILFKQIDNSTLIIFRVLFGLLISLESFGAILTGWVDTVLLEPKFTFSFIGLEWLQPLPDFWMHTYYIIMGICGIMVMIGYKYRISMITFTVLWAGTYFMQKSAYNNHYYLLILLSIFMSLVPANRSLSLDARKNPAIQTNTMWQWCSIIFIIQMWIVYTYATIAKLYPDWLNASVVELLFRPKADYFLIGDLLQQKWIHYTVAYFGIFFDLLIVPLLLWKPSRKYAFYVAIFFHLFNSIVFQIGIFPYMSLALCIFFFDPEMIRKKFLSRQKKRPIHQIASSSNKALIKGLFISYFIIQILLPLRHLIIKDDVLWTEEGHRLSWRMMLRVKSGILKLTVIDNRTNQKIPIKAEDYLSTKQQRHIATKPDMLWQFAQYLKQLFKEESNQDISIYVESQLKVNNKPYQPFIDPTVDLASVKWDAFKHSHWILPSKQD